MKNMDFRARLIILIKHLIVTCIDLGRKKTSVSKFQFHLNQDPLSGHLFNLEGRKWKNLRSKLTPAFSSGKMKRMFYLLVECCEELQRLIDASCNGDRSTIEVRELATKFTIDVIGSCAFGIQINALTNEESEFHQAAKRLSKPSYKATLWRMLRTALPGLYRLLGVQIIDPNVTIFFKNVVSQMIGQRERTGSRRHDFMDLLIELKNKGVLENESGARIYDNETAQAAKEIGKVICEREHIYLFFYSRRLKINCDFCRIRRRRYRGASVRLFRRRLRNVLEHHRVLPSRVGFESGNPRKN